MTNPSRNHGSWCGTLVSRAESRRVSYFGSGSRSWCPEHRSEAQAEFNT